MEAARSARHPATALPGAGTAACSGLAEVRSGLGRCRNPERIQPLRSTEKRRRDGEKGAELGAWLPWRRYWRAVSGQRSPSSGTGSCLESACAPAEQAPAWLGSLGSNKDAEGGRSPRVGCRTECLSCIPLRQGCFSPAGLTGAQAASLRGKGRPTPQQPSGVSKQKDLSLKAWP